MSFNEDTRVKLPAIITFVKLGYKYLSLKGFNYDIDTNIIPSVFEESLIRVNPTQELKPEEFKKIIDKIRIESAADDLGRTFYKRLINQSGIKLIDFNDFANNTFNVVTEYTCKNGEDEFRPDITLLINGIPLAFIEVKKPNNKEGILAERNRMSVRFQNNKFRRFINLAQVMVFSNNMAYDDNDFEHLQGAYYCTGSKSKAFFNHFREEYSASLLANLADIKETDENFILADNNYSVIKSSDEYQNNKLANTPTNSIILSLFSRDRLADFLRYGIAYIEYTDDDGIFHLEKHIMRYPQFFATKAIKKNIDGGTKKGVIWHTQGSGKTALAFFNIEYLKDYFQKQNKIAHFYFIVDRLDLKDQSMDEFSKRGLKVETIDSRDDFIKEIQKPAQASSKITVLNIHKFSEDSKAIESESYNLNVQRVYFIDEAHRSYNPKGSFLANLINSDPNAIIISLTGTPLLGDSNKIERKKLATREVFGDYIHKYYYNQSISDGYTLKLIREDIETRYKMGLSQILNDIEIKQGSREEKIVFANQNYVSKMLEYIVKDLETTRVRFADDSIGAMVVCHSSEQAKALQKEFDEKYKEKSNSPYIANSSTLILHDVGDKSYRKDEVKAFKKGNIDILFVYNMLLTGFDSPRLKKLYLNREVRSHNLLQTLTRVNRPYRSFKYGFVVDFADIRKEFDRANQAYWEELNNELGDVSDYENLFKSQEEIKKDIEDIKDILWEYDTTNKESFRKQIDSILEKKTLIDLKKALSLSKELYNLIRLYGHDELLEKLDFNNLKALENIVSDRLNLVNLSDRLQNSADNTSLINEALEDVVFSFVKTSSIELIIADALKQQIAKTRDALRQNIDHKDPRWLKLGERLKEIFQNRNLEEITEQEIHINIRQLEEVYKAVMELNRKNSNLLGKYNGDAKFVRTHNFIERENLLNEKKEQIAIALNGVKENLDKALHSSMYIKDNSGYFNRLVENNIANVFYNNEIYLNEKVADRIGDFIASEYINEKYNI